MFIEAPPETEDLAELRDWCYKMWQRLLEDNLYGSDTWDAGNITDVDGATKMEAKEVTVTGAAVGDYAVASLSIDIADLVLDAQVTAANTVTCVLANNTDGAIDLASATVYVRVFRRTT